MAKEKERLVLPYSPRPLQMMQTNLELRREREYREKLTPQQRRHYDAAIRALEKERMGLEGKRDPDIPVFDAAGGRLFVKGEWRKLSQGERDVLKFLVSQGTATITELRDHSSSPHKVLKRICEKYPTLKKYITRPGGPGRGGYSTTIKPA
jgi:hypothetical protein